MKRREFLKNLSGVAVTAVAAPMIVPAKVLGRNGAVAPSNTITMGCIGVGWQGTGNMENFLQLPDCKVIAVCDIDKNHLNNAKSIVDKKYGNTDCDTYHYFEELLQRNDIDTVMLGLPDHWHAIPAIASADAGKDIFGEKPFSHSLREGRAMIEAIERNGRIWQTGSWQRSQSNFRIGAQIVRNGWIGKLKHVEVGLPSGHADFAGTFGQEEIKDPPEELDYERWLGPAPYAPYSVARVHKNWRWIYDYGGGQLMDWVGHHVDIAHWGCDLDRTAPIEVEGTGEFPNHVLRESAIRYKVFTTYANGIKMILAGGYDDVFGGRSGTKWVGEDGWVAVARGNFLQAEPASLLRQSFSATDIHLYESLNHFRNFIDCVKTRKETITPAQVAHSSATPGHLGQISMLLGGKTIQFDPENEVITNDAKANELLMAPYHSPWKL